MSSDLHSPARPTAIVVTIDGPSGAGKSTVARALAQELGVVHLDTGAMFRAVTVFLLDAGFRFDAAVVDEAGVARALPAMDLDLDGAGVVQLGGRPLGPRLRTPEVEAAVSAVSALPAVRNRLRELQRAFGRRGSLVCEGRDMGTVVFPDAAFKFFLDASVDERARRRARDFAAAGGDAALETVRAALVARDAKDSTRAVAPLVAAPDAVRVDTTGLGVDEVVARLASHVRAGLAGRAARA